MTHRSPTLEHAARGQPLLVLDLEAPAAAPAWAQRLAELGFEPGERVTVLHRGWLGGEPLIVRIGPSMFALRRAEAACVRVVPLLGERPAARRPGGAPAASLA